MLKENDKVKYTGYNRPYLKDLDGTVLSLNAAQTSALVSFKRPNGYTPYQEWVGFGALEKIESTSQSIEDQIRSELRTVTTEFNEVYSKYTELKNRKDRLESALSALTGRNF